MLRSLPCEILLEICEYLSFRDICNLQNITSKINRISNILVSNELQKFDYPITQEVMHEVIDLFCKSAYDINTITKKPVARIIKHVYQYFKIHGSVENFPCKIILFAFYKLLEIEILKSYTNVKYNIHFLHSFNVILDSVTYSYFRGIDLKSLTLNDMHVVSSYVVTLPLLKKLFGIKFLDLSKTNFVTCCRECVSENLISICLLKYNRPNDCFLSMNYRTIKEFLRNNAYHLYRKIEFIELNMVNKHVMIKHPYRNCYMPITSRGGKKQIYYLRDTPPLLSKEYTQIRRSICNSQKELKKYYFS